jgi:large subunit ribosomal protein L21
LKLKRPEKVPYGCKKVGGYFAQVLDAFAELSLDRNLEIREHNALKFRRKHMSSSTAVKTPKTAKKSLQFPYAVVRTGGKQYRVAEGDMILVEKLEVEPGSTWTAEDVLFLAKGPGDIQIGQPQVSGAKVTFEVLQQTLDSKILIRHSRRRHNSRKTMGHRQPQTRILVKSIKA